MDKSIFSEEWINGFNIVFGEEAESILDKINDDLVNLMDILYGKIKNLDKLLTPESVAKLMENKEYQIVAEAYYKSFLAPKLLEDVIKINQTPRR